MRGVIASVAIGLALAGCAHTDTVMMSESKLEGPKEIALSARSSAWLPEIEKRIRQKGFKVFRTASQRSVREQVSPTRSEEYKEAAARYILVIDGQPNLDPMRRCFGGGWYFFNLTAELIDARTNESVMTVSGAGYSEGCPPASSSLYQNIADSLDKAWK